MELADVVARTAARVARMRSDGIFCCWLWFLYLVGFGLWQCRDVESDAWGLKQRN